MIRILSYEEHPQGKAILDRYLYIATYVLPFDPKDVLDDDKLEVDGVVYTAQNFKKLSGKRARRRTDGYNALLSHFGIPNVTGYPRNKLEQDQLLAAKLIWSASTVLYHYLYCTQDPLIEPATLPPIRRDNLRRLLISKMDALDSELERIKITNENASKLLLKEVFRYEAFSDNDHTANLLETMDVNVCPYCNRLYTVTLTGKSGKSRAQFDHYKNKSQYPHFAVSLMNLIPSCGLCNQSKGDKEKPVLYPYSDEMGLAAVFRTKPKTSLGYLTGNQEALDEFSVELKLADSLSKELADKIRNSDELFKLTSLYNHHKDYILYLFWKNYVFSKEYLEELCEEFPEMFHSFEDAKNIMYLMDINQTQWGRRSLGKLTHDIDMEINENSYSALDLHHKK